MNNSSIQPDSLKNEFENKTQEHEAKLVRIVEAIGRMKELEAWSTLKTEIFDGLSTNLKRDLLTEAKKEDPNPNKLNRLAGELKWAEKFSNLDKFEESQRVELKAIRSRIHGKPD